MSNRPKSPRTKKRTSPTVSPGWIAIIVAIIGLISAVTVAYFQYYLPLKTSIMTTQTAEVKLTALAPSITPISTPALVVLLTPTPVPPTATTTFTPTYTPTPTETPFPTPTIIPGQDFEANCIDSGFWTPYKGETHPKDNKGCWELSDWGISAQDGGLLLAKEDFTGYSRSIYTVLPENAEIRFTVRIDKLTTIVNSDSNLVFGIGNADQWLLAGKYLIYRVISPDSLVYALYTSSVLEAGMSYFSNYTLGQEQRVVFSIKGLLLDIYIDDLKVLGSVTLSPSDKKVFWIGFHLPTSGNITAFIKDVRVVKK